MRRLWRRLWFTLRRDELEASLREELDFHRYMKEQELLRAGDTPDAAAVNSRRALGNDLAARAMARDVWTWPWLQDVMQDVRVAARLLVKDRRLTVATIVALSLGLGATTTAFTFVRGALLRELPLADADRLVLLQTVDARGRPLGVSYADARDWRAAARTLSHLGVSLELSINIAEDTLTAQRFYGSFVSFDLFGMVGQHPALGRGFTADDDRAGAPRVALIAHSVWQSRYGGDPSVIGRAVRVNDVPSTIVGVMPPGFHFPATTEIWVPIGQIRAASADIDATRGNRPPLVLGLGRLADGASFAQAHAELQGISARLARDHPTTNDGMSATIEPLERLLRGSMRAPALMAMGAVSFVLLIACVNVANLLLARAVDRGQEMAIRGALGATRWRIVRQLSVESLLLTSAAGLLGVVLSVYGVRLFASQLLQLFAGVPAPYWLDFSVDGPVFAFLALVALGSCLLFGVAPALHVTRSTNETLQSRSRDSTSSLRARRWAAPLVAAQLGLTLVLLAGTGLLLRSFLAVGEAGRVVDPANLMTMQIALSAQRYTQPAQIKQFFRQLDDRLSVVPAFSGVTLASDIPLRTAINATREVTIYGRDDVPANERPTVAYLFVGPRYFSTLNLPILRGRDLSEDDGMPGREGAIVNERFASMFFAGGDAIGQRIQLTNPTALNAPRPWFTIVGIAPTVPQIVLRETPEPVVYVPVSGEPAPHRFVSIIVRAAGDRATTVARLREEVRAVDADLPGHTIRTMDEIVAMSQWQYRVLGSMFGLMAGIALVLATVGLSAIVAHGVASRTREIGVRLALGADLASVVWLFAKGVMMQLTIGLIVGLAGAVALGRLLARTHADPYAQTFLIGTGPADPLAFGVVSGLLILVATTAGVWQARRAAQVNPLVALRHD